MDRLGDAARARIRCGGFRLGLTFVIGTLLACTSTGTDPSARAVADGPVAARAPHEPVKFEPPTGRIYHFSGGTVGGQESADEDYARALGVATAPMGDSVFIDLPGTRPFNHVLRALNTGVAPLKRSGRAMNLTVGFSMRGTSGYSTAGDEKFAETSEYDGMADELIRMIKDSGIPTFVRLGGEINGEWQGNHPYVLPKAYRKMVQMFRDAGVENVAFVWCVEGHGDSAIDERNARGEYKWFPGDDVIDWYGLDVFPVQHFDRGAAERARQRGRGSAGGATAVADKLLAMARSAGKPVMIGETSPINTQIPPSAEDGDGQEAHRVWNAWFVPFIRFLDAHPEIKAVSMFSVDWRRTPNWSEWGDCRIHENARLTALWREELQKSRWINLEEWSKLRAP